MNKETFEKAKKIVEQISKWESEISYLKKLTTEEKGDYSIRDVRWGNGNTSPIPQDAKKVVLDVLKGHYESTIFKLKKELEAL